MDRINKDAYVSGGMIGVGKGKTQGSKVKSSKSHTTSKNQKKETSFDSLFLDNSQIVDSSSLLDNHGNINEEVLSQLQDDIHLAGEVLLAKLGIDAVLNYRQKVQNLLSSVSPLLHSKKKITAHKRVGNSFEERKYTLIYTVHQKLDKLLRLIVNSQSEQMKIMKALDEIRGLIINILQ